MNHITCTCLMDNLRMLSKTSETAAIMVEISGNLEVGCKGTITRGRKKRKRKEEEP